MTLATERILVASLAAFYYKL
ncbi:uncharacterized protein FPRN_15189 [Fusarium proliferatum]|nr:uncharacterized protein FPRN_15189 [Fusarium proliferatum]